MKKSEINSSFFLAQTTAGRQALKMKKSYGEKVSLFFLHIHFYSILCIQYNM
jgi:hypothetical protein